MEAASVRPSFHEHGLPVQHGCGCSAHWLPLCAQIAGCTKMELSSSWAVSPSSLKRFFGLPMAYPTPSALQTTSACWPASGWKSPPHDGAPRGRELLFQKSSLDQRLEISLASGNFDPRNVGSPPPPFSHFPVVRFSPGLSMFSACGPCPPQPPPHPVPHTRWPWERQKGGVSPYFHVPSTPP